MPCLRPNGATRVMTDHQSTVFIVDDDPSVRRGLSRLLNVAGLNVEAPFGVSYQPFSGQWSLSSDTSVNYMMLATKPA